MALDLPIEKASVAEAEDGHHSGRSADENNGHSEMIGTSHHTTLASFSHLDEKKILRKVNNGREGGLEADGRVCLLASKLTTRT